MQEEVEKALRQLGWQGQHIKAAGRTDTGVHASGQVIAFDLDWKHSSEKLQQALNAYLPADVAARSIRPVAPDFDPRRHALARTYRYQLFFEANRDPLRERYAWRVWPAAEMGLVRQVAGLFIGEHDFAAFGTPPRVGSSTVRTVMESTWLQDRQGWTFQVTANAFLYHMVRHLVAAQILVGQGVLSREELCDQLDRPRDRDGKLHSTQGLADPHGLFLIEVRYPAHRLAIE